MSSQPPQIDQRVKEPDEPAGTLPTDRAVFGVSAVLVLGVAAASSSPADSPRSRTPPSWSPCPSSW
ncbi:hypothetical protein ACPC54_28880 [Kitasatospora sp. NPDC094028]